MMMAARHAQLSGGFTVEQLRARFDCFSGPQTFAPVPPDKVIISNPRLMNVWRSSASFAKIMFFVEACSEAVCGVRCASPFVVKNPTVKYITQIFFPWLRSLVERIPLEPRETQRYGNAAKRVFHRELEKELLPHMQSLVATLPLVRDAGEQIVALPSRDPSMPTREVTKFVVEDPYTVAYLEDTSNDSPWRKRTPEEEAALAAELCQYIKDSFGNAVRLDYGSGHELHFFIFLMICLEEHRDLGGLTNPQSPLRCHEVLGMRVGPPVEVPGGSVGEEVYVRRQEFILGAFYEYMKFMRFIQTHYNLEPAGSHGVWGLDDFHHLPYVFGAAQLLRFDPPKLLIPLRESASAANAAAMLTHVLSTVIEEQNNGVFECFLPSDVCSKEKVAKNFEAFFYLQCIQWIYEKKQGPFHEHSNMLYNITAVPSWMKTYTGMLKMFAAEVLGKFNVTQHLLLGAHLPWNTADLREKYQCGTIEEVLLQWAESQKKE